MNTQNNIKKILNDRGFKQVIPTDDFLKQSDLTIHRFNKIIENKVEITLTEAAIFSNLLNVPIEELTSAPTTETFNLGDKFGLKQP